jgi:predicted nucleic acid-binding Zn ribbon protein
MFCQFCGSALRPDARFCSGCVNAAIAPRRNGPRKAVQIILVTFGVLAVLWTLGKIVLDHRFAVGSEVVLSETAYVFGSQDDLDTFEKRPADDLELFRRAIKITSGTRVRIVKSDSDRRCIAPIEGNQQGKEGWVELAWLQQRSAE